MKTRSEILEQISNLERDLENLRLDRKEVYGQGRFTIAALAAAVNTRISSLEDKLDAITEE